KSLASPGLQRSVKKALWYRTYTEAFSWELAHALFPVLGSIDAEEDLPDYPNLTFVISDLGVYDTNRPDSSISPFTLWPYPAIARAKGLVGALLLSDIFSPGIMVDADCKVKIVLFAPKLQKQTPKTAGTLHRCIPLSWSPGV